MKIALLHPTFWPEVRRGSERLIHDLATSLAGRGHEVTLVTSHPDPATVTSEDGFRVIRNRRPPPFPGDRLYEHHVAAGPQVFWRLLREDFDLVHAFFAVDALAALAARRLGGPPVVFSFHGIPVRKYLVGRRYRLEGLARIASEVAAVTVLSEAAAGRWTRYLGRKPTVLPGGVLRESFLEGDAVARAPEPTLVCAASLGDPYKRGEFLLSGFEEARRERPDLQLHLVENRDPFLGWVKLDLPDGVHYVSGDDTQELAHAYGSAWASVTASVEEAFGLVVLESLACGTPVLASRSGGLPELVGEEVGRLFEPDDLDSLVAGIGETLAMAESAEVAAKCRERAADYAWERVVVRYEALYEKVTQGAEVEA